MLASFLHNQRAVLVLGFGFLMLLLFWLTVSLPSPEQFEMPDVIGDAKKLFVNDKTMKIVEGQPLYQTILYSYINWIISILAGILFAVSFASTLILLLRYWEFQTVHGQYIRNTLKGVAAGVPLGLCVNCTASIAKGVIESGQQKELALAMLFSSPLLNVVVIIMSFSFLPFEMASVRMVEALLLLMILPYLLKALGNVSTPRYQIAQSTIGVKVQNMMKDTLPPIFPKPAETDWKRSARMAALDFWRHFKYLFLGTFPILLLAGFLGIIATHTIDWEIILPNLEADLNIGTLLIASFVAGLLPLTMGLDVIASYGFLELGIPAPLVTAMLFPFGSFSILAFLALWQVFNIRLAMSCFFLTWMIGFGGGLFHLYFL